MSSTPLLPHIDDDVAAPEFTERLLDELLAAMPGAAPVTVPRRSGRRWARALAACVIAVAAFALLAPRLRDSPTGVGAGPATANAAQVLRTAAKAAGRQLPLAPGQYLRWTSWRATAGRARFLVEPLSGTALIRSDTRCTAAGCEIRDAGSAPEPAPPVRYGPGFSARQLQQLPTDPAALLRTIERRARHAIDPNGYRGDPWEGGYSLLVAPLPGVRVLGREQVGQRKGVALERRVPSPGGAPAGWRVIVVDPRTGELLAARGYIGAHRLSDSRVYHTAVVGSPTE